MSLRTMPFLLLPLLCPGADDLILPSSLRCEYLVEPLAVAVPAPRLSWVPESARRGERQTAYAILVASSPELLAAGTGDLWDSGKTPATDGSALVGYGGAPLASRQACWWKVRCWDRDDRPGPWSAPAHFEVGLQSAADWQARWIAAPTGEPADPSLLGAQWIWHPQKDIDLRKQGPLGERFFRTTITIPAGITPEACSLVLVADDAFTLTVNGQEVARSQGPEAWRTPQRYDLLPHLVSGVNALGVAAANSEGRAGLCARLVLQLPGQPPLVTVSDRRWRSSSQAAAGWDTAAFDDRPWSAAGEIGRLGCAPWGRIGAPERHPVPLVRSAFSIEDRPLRRARLYATALGLMSFQLNGTRLGDQVLAPDWTDYNKRLRYQAYDVTAALRPGANVLGAQLANGWYGGHIGNGGFRFYGGEPALLAQLEVTYADGSIQRVLSDAGWRWHPGPITSSDFMLGESHDARLAVAGWSAPGSDDHGWAPVAVRAVTPRPIDPPVMDPVREVRTLTPVSVGAAGPGEWIYDLGQNMVGVARLTVDAPAGTVVTLHHAEMLNPDGSLYLANLRGAPSVDTYVCRGGGPETWQPAFTFHGFRYLAVGGLPAAPAVDAVHGVVLSSIAAPAGSFTCSDARINQLQSNIWWGLIGNYLSVPTDCPQRDERLGWMGDAQVFVRTATGNADVAAFFSKWLVDVDDAQTADGAYGDVSPQTTMNAGTPAWGDAGVICPWTVYRAYGDLRLLARHYPNMRRWSEWCHSHSEGGLRKKHRGNDYGDWLSQKADTPKEVIGTAYHAYTTALVAQAAEALGKAEDAALLRQRFQDIKSAFNAAYVRPDGRITGDTQCVYLMALRFGLVEGAAKEQAVRHLVDDIAAKDTHLSTGFVGVSYLLPVLSAHGQDALAMSLLMQDSFPSWLFSVKHGATTIWERWDGWTPDRGFQNPGMNSFNHYSLGSCGEWMYESLAGLAQAEDSVGWQRLVIHPRIGGGLRSASHRLMTIRGAAASAWSVGEEETAVTCTIPVGSSALVLLPTTDAARVTERERPLATCPDIRSAAAVPGTVALTVGSGTYRFAWPTH